MLSALNLTEHIDLNKREATQSEMHFLIISWATFVSHAEVSGAFQRGERLIIFGINHHAAPPLSDIS